MNKNHFFFELIQVSSGSRICLSHSPSADEWSKLYAMVKKQSLVGVCFSGVQKLQSQRQEPPEMLYLTWMGMAAKIQQRNELVNRRCTELQARLTADGFRSCVLKGQGVGLLYAEHLLGFRQSGDIDLWIDAPKNMVVAWAEKVGVKESAGYLHVGARVFPDADVELHYRPTYMRSLRHNKRLQKFCEEHKADWVQRAEIVVPSWEFDVVYQLSHIYRHLFGLGVGLRQMMDYFFVLRAVPEVSRTKFPEVSKTLKHLGLYDFAGAVMYVLREVFLLDEQYMICPEDEKRGRMLLDMVMQTGNFGHLDKKQRIARSTAVGSLLYKLKQWIKLVRLYPEETLSAPVWTLARKIGK